MAIQSSIYTNDGVTRTYPSTKHIPTKQHVGVYALKVSDGLWENLNPNLFLLVNNSVVFFVAPTTAEYSQIEIRVVDSSNELLDSPSNISIVASNINSINTDAININDINTNATNISYIKNVSNNIGDVNTTALHITSVDTVATSILSVNNVSSNISAINTANANAIDISSVATTIVPNITEILQADTNATTATAQAGIATTQADIATAQASTATTQAGISTAQANLSSGYATTALNHLNEFKGIYLGSFTTAPSSGMTEGDLYWSSTLKLLYVYNQTASSWVPSVQPSSTSKTETNVTITSYQQIVSSTYTVGLVEVYLNGVRLTSGLDYIATNGTTINPTIGAMYSWTVGDSMLIVTYALNSISSYSSAEIDAFLATKANTASPTFTGIVSGITKDMVGLSNIDNTSDLSKPVSTAIQTALNLKANLLSPSLTGTPTSTTAIAGTDTTQIATTAFVKAEIPNSIHSYASKATPVDADEFPIIDSASSFSPKKLTLDNLKATLKTYFDDIYASLTSPIFSGSLSVKNIIYKNTPVTITSWSYATTTITLNVASHTFVDGDYIEVGGLTATTNIPNGVHLVTSVTATTIVFTYALTPTGTAGVSSATVKGYVTTNGRTNGIGVGQTWQNVAGSRISGTTYTNTTGNPIMVAVSYYTNAIGAACNIKVNNVTIQGNQLGSSLYFYLTCFAVVPNGSTYSVNAHTTWLELR